MLAGDLVSSCKTSYDPETKIWSGIKVKPTYGEDCSLGGVILEALLKNPEKIFQICHHNGKSYTNGEIAKLAVQCAQHFKNLGLSQDDFIGVAGVSHDFIAPVVFGAWLCGLTVNTMKPGDDMSIVKKIHNKQKLAMFFTIASDYERLRTCLNDSGIQKPIYLLDENTNGYVDARNITELFQGDIDVKSFKSVTLQHGCNQTAAIVRTSGSTGIPKAVCLPHTLLNCVKYETGLLLGNCIIYWRAGVFQLFNACLSGFPILVNETGYNATIMQELIEKYKVSSMYLSFHSLSLMLESKNFNSAAFSSLRRLVLGGCHIPYSLIKKAKALMPNTTFYFIYGSSECGRVSFGPANECGHVGQLMPNREVKIIDENGKHLGPGEFGEVCIRNNYIPTAYYDAPESAKAVYKDGWIHMNDIGYIDEEGNLYICERKNDIIECNQEIIFPSEIESIIYELPGILEVGVCGIPDVSGGYDIAAAVHKKEDCNLTSKEICDYVAQRLGHEKSPRGGIYFTTALPRTASGKILRAKCTYICEYKRKLQLSEDPENSSHISYV